MTNREREIKEMAEIINDDYCQMFDDGQGQDCNLDCEVCRATRLYDVGYRKADEVRKEIENEIFSRLYDEIRMNFRRNSEIKGEELLEFIQYIESMMFKEEE